MDPWTTPHVQKVCDHCGEQLAILESAATRDEPAVDIAVVCPMCFSHTHLLMGISQLFGARFPHLVDVAHDTRPENDNASFSLRSYPSHSEPPPPHLLH